MEASWSAARRCACEPRGACARRRDPRSLGPPAVAAVVTSAAFRRLALALPESVEVGHMGHPDFRVRGRIFATLGHPDDGHAMVKLTPAQQEALLRAEPDVFAPVPGAWGRGGATHVRLRAARVASLRLALAAAWRNVAPRALVARDEQRARAPRRRRTS